MGLNGSRSKALGLLLASIMLSATLFELADGSGIGGSVRIIKIRFCSKAHGRLWDYDLKPGSVFAPGEDAFVYFDVMGFSRRPVKISLEGSLYDPFGGLLPFPPGKVEWEKVDVWDYPQEVLFFWYPFRVPETAKEGIYKVLLKATDLISGIESEEEAYLYISMEPPNFVKTKPSSASYRIEGVKWIGGERNWCGTISLTMVLNYWGDRISPWDVGSRIDPKNMGVWGGEMMWYAMERNFTVVELHKREVKYRNSTLDEVKMWVSHGYPVIVSQYFGIPPYERDGHVRVVVGYDDSKSIFYTMDPAVGSLELYYGTFKELWEPRNWGMVLVPLSIPIDSDHDGLGDGLEAKIGTDPFNRDSDGDGIGDGLEFGIYGTIPLIRNGEAQLEAMVLIEEANATISGYRGDIGTKAKAILERAIVAFRNGDIAKALTLARLAKWITERGEMPESYYGARRSIEEARAGLEEMRRKGLESSDAEALLGMANEACEISMRFLEEYDFDNARLNAERAIGLVKDARSVEQAYQNRKLITLLLGVIVAVAVALALIYLRKRRIH